MTLTPEFPTALSRELRRRESARAELYSNARRDQGLLEALASEAGGRIYEDRVYRFYHHSFKVYDLQDLTLRLVAALTRLAPPGTELAADFMTIVAEGTNKTWERSHNSRWAAETRPILEAFFHARYMVEMAAACAALETYPTGLIPTPWATLTTLYGIR